MQHEHLPSHLRPSRAEQQHRHKPLVEVPLRGKNRIFLLPTTLASSPNLPRRRIRGSPTLGGLEKRGKGHCRFQTDRHVKEPLLPLLAAEYNASGVNQPAQRPYFYATSLEPNTDGGRRQEQIRARAPSNED
ncbi:unnamed protein product [Musa hybrid cultivar]